MLLFIGVKSDKDWINEIAEISTIGHLFVFTFIFLPPVGASFVARMFIPGLNNDTGFTKAMFVLLPSWNLLMWFLKVRLYFLFIPAWVLFGIVAIIKIITKSIRPLIRKQKIPLSQDSIL